MKICILLLCAAVSSMEYNDNHYRTDFGEPYNPYQPRWSRECKVVDLAENSESGNERAMTDKAKKKKSNQATCCLNLKIPELFKETPSSKMLVALDIDENILEYVKYKSSCGGYEFGKVSDKHKWGVCVRPGVADVLKILHVLKRNELIEVIFFSNGGGSKGKIKAMLEANQFKVKVKATTRKAIQNWGIIERSYMCEDDDIVPAKHPDTVKEECKANVFFLQFGPRTANKAAKKILKKSWGKEKWIMIDDKEDNTKNFKYSYRVEKFEPSKEKKEGDKVFVNLATELYGKLSKALKLESKFRFERQIKRYTERDENKRNKENAVEKVSEVLREFFTKDLLNKM